MSERGRIDDAIDALQRISMHVSLADAQRLDAVLAHLRDEQLDRAKAARGRKKPSN